MGENKIQRTFRVSESIDGEIQALIRGNETTTAAYTRVLEAGIRAIKGGTDSDGGNVVNSQLYNVLQDNIKTLQEQLEHEREQITACRAQLDAALNLVSQEQSLRLVEAKREPEGNKQDVSTGQGGTAEPGEEPIAQSPAIPLTLGRALKFWFNGTRVVVNDEL